MKYHPLTPEEVSEKTFKLFEKYGIKKAAVFGSCARNEMHRGSDVDILVEFTDLSSPLLFVELKRREKYAYYWKNHGEIDFVIKNKDQTLTAINVSYSNKIEERETQALVDFKKKFGKKVKELVLLTDDIEEEKGEIKLIPLWKWFLEPIRSLSCLIRCGILKR